MEKTVAKRILNECEKLAKEDFRIIEDVALYNQKKVLNAFQKNRVSSMHFQGTTGYGYDDVGREMLNKVFSDIMHCEASIVSPQIANGTHAITLALFGILRPNDMLLSITGKPYDTLDEVINGENNGSLKDFGIKYSQIELNSEGEFDYKAILNALSDKPKAVFIQRSKGYEWRDALTMDKICNAVLTIKKQSPDTIIIVDNCYGEFVEKIEPTDAGADVVVGSLIKNPGGGIAPSGGYICGRKTAIDQISYRLTAPSLGTEVGSYESGYRLFFQGLFIAPSVVLNAIKGSILASYVFAKMGYKTMPEVGVMPADIIESVKFDTAEELIKFCQVIQTVSPIDSYVTPEPWDMPGYSHKVIMAAGTFVQGASIELTADGTIREPYVAYLQGGLTYEHYKIALLELLEKLG